ncbi:MAG: methionine--tRNA ligase [Bdellovibrionaceae bacterium]|nr:methionine--tRNA ligase [Pseudobdellovibrionaceae bacterium]MDW8190395.1 methionine--tRNA ligase [Pseudobdellovibrionaceae bacterium]
MNNSSKSKILVTTALPYANGPLHLGHIFENILADFWVRYLKMKKNEVYFYCADDTHGSAVMIEARKQGQIPEEFIKSISQSHQEDFRGFLIDHSFYFSTHSETNRQLCHFFYQKMQEKGTIERRHQSQLYCPHDQMFLPDRFVKGQCPNCGATEQYGDSCEACGATYSAFQLKNPACAICGTQPELQTTEQIFFKLNLFKELLQESLPQITDPATAKKMSEWFRQDLRDWDISRNGPYFGFPIPGESNKFFYVWLDAPMGYIATSLEHQKSLGQDGMEFWIKDSPHKVYHFIGKDITYFHTLFWPALLKVADLRLPNFVFVHGFVKVNGHRMSKSRGNFILAKQYLQHLPPEALRYYFASKASATSQDDIDFNLDDFVARANAELVGKFVNLFSRSIKLLEHFNYQLGELSTAMKSYIKQVSHNHITAAEKAYENQQYHLVIDQTRQLADEANRFFDERAPWKTIKNDEKATLETLTVTLNLAKNLALILKPIIPEISKKALSFFHTTQLDCWDDLHLLLEKTSLTPYQNLFTRITPDSVRPLIQPSDSTHQKVATPATKQGEPLTLIKIDDFAKIDLRVAEVVEAQAVEGSERLLSLKVFLGPLGYRHIFAGLKKSYPNPSELIGKKIAVVANLEPRKMKFGISEAMALAVGTDERLAVLEICEKRSKPGDPIK